MCIQNISYLKKTILMFQPSHKLKNANFNLKLMNTDDGEEKSKTLLNFHLVVDFFPLISPYILF